MRRRYIVYMQAGRVYHDALGNAVFPFWKALLLIHDPRKSCFGGSISPVHPKMSSMHPSREEMAKEEP